ncbi:hypothetical protein ACFLZT_02340 [Thermodesulfobacteriota bacterium]
MVDWKNQLGIIVPSGNTVMEYEWSRLVPAGVSVHSCRIPHNDSSDDTSLQTVKEAAEAAELLAHAKVQAICFGCTVESFQTIGIDLKIIREIETATKTIATTTTTAIIDALKYLGIESVAIASPYPQQINELFAKYLAHSGFKVMTHKGLADKNSAAMPPETACNLAIEVNSKEAEAIIISCSNFRSLEVIERLEKELEKPVIASNTASLWKTLRLAQVKDQVPDAGMLFK